MPNAVFVAPFFLDATVRFIDAAAGLPGVRLALISQDSEERLPDSVRQRIAGHYRVNDALSASDIADAVRHISAALDGVHALVGMLEQLQEPLGAVRDALGIPGMTESVARNFRDKDRMKDVFDANGVPCARHGVVTSADAARRVAADVRLPLVVKPPAGAGARATFRIDDASQLDAWLDVDPPSPRAPALLEQLLHGDEHSFDSVVLDGRVAWWSVSRYLPTPLDVLRNPWIQWVVVLPRSLDAYGDIREQGERALQALGLQRGLTHLEWFRLEDGGVAVSEVAARPPGAQFTSMLSYAHDTDMYADWARLEILGAFAPPERRYAVGAAYLRGQGSGVVAAVRGLDVLQQELGDLVVEAHMPKPGQPGAGTYEGEGHVIVRHEDTAVVERAVRRIVEVARIELVEA
ncbi:MAG: hypothetical protein JOY80_01665 [Candidatus Dormibacteraeota bacterium]|nr:hypothetical protein [Candidatus Dormibacteraeota bacterium]